MKLRSICKACLIALVAVAACLVAACGQEQEGSNLRGKPGPIYTEQQLQDVVKDFSASFKGKHVLQVRAEQGQGEFPLVKVYVQMSPEWAAQPETERRVSVDVLADWWFQFTTKHHGKLDPNRLQLYVEYPAGTVVAQWNDHDKAQLLK